MRKYEDGSTVYFVENGKYINSAVVKSYSGGMYLILTGPEKALRLRESRLFSTKEEARLKTLGPRSPYDDILGRKLDER